MAGRFRAGFDGGSRGNPGPAAWGVVVTDASGRALEGFAGSIGRATNNVAEYSGLLEALALAAARGADDVELVADSELVVKQIRGEYKVRHPDLIPLHGEAARRIAGFKRFSIGHVPRRRNADADKLVNRALNLAEAGSGDAPVRIHETFE
ncbi:MAG TPA: reverse transcriptase-like protein [Candidatus Polarisedimenticolaceae bacterium]|nr:reverse transcriptase-like protein [Candidatus Polarisedimenticolaceae bacterium]